ncbi:hypothetical protein [Sphingosinithalassobacter portus]|uniref:hypothetical protein n=1 Tax=Stakelama portus TaxID=2676234 RepID=UPI000D6E7953|nr:hypothetical protein [Sphingosinithalassobacter portus]
MTLIFEIAGGIILAVSLLAIVAVFWRVLFVALAGVAALAGAAVGIAVFYSICGGSWACVALSAACLGISCAAIYLICHFNGHRKYGPSFRAMGDSIGVGLISTTFLSILVLMPVSTLLGYYWADSRANSYLMGVTVSAVFIYSARAYYGYALRRELEAARNMST